MIRVIKPFVDILDKTVIHSVGEEVSLTKERETNAVNLGYAELVAEAKPVVKKTKASK